MFISGNTPFYFLGKMRSSQHLIQSGARTSHCCVPCTYNPAGKLLAETWLPAGTPGKTGFSLQGHNSCWSTAASFRKMMSPAGGAEWRCDWSEHQHPVCDVTLMLLYLYIHEDGSVNVSAGSLVVKLWCSSHRWHTGTPSCGINM